MIEKASNKESDMILMGDLNYDYVVNESLHADPIHYIETLYDMSQLINEKTRVTQCTESTLDVILTTNPSLNYKSQSPQTFRCDQDNFKWPLFDIHWTIFTEENTAWYTQHRNVS